MSPGASSASEDSEDEEELNELQALQDELAALRSVLGEAYREEGGRIAVEASGGDASPDESPSADGAEEIEPESRQVPAETEDRREREWPSIGAENGAWPGDARHPRAGALRAALAANRAIQARLKRLLESIESAASRNADAEACVAALRARKRQAGALRSASSGLKEPAFPVPSRAWAVGDEPPPLHPEAAVLAPVYRYLPHTFPSTALSREDVARLRGAVIQLVQEKRTNAVLEAVEAELAAGQPLTPADIQARCAGVEALTLDDPGVEAATLAFDRGDWQVVQQRAGVASGASGCRLAWVNGLRPGLRHDAYEPEEDAALADAVARLGVHQWPAVAADLGGKRTAIACLRRWLELERRASSAPRSQEGGDGPVPSGMEAGTAGPSAGPARQGGELSPDQLSLLARLMQRHGPRWKMLAEKMGPGWDRQSLMHAWRRHTQRGSLGGGTATPRRGKWTALEDDALQRAIALHGKTWVAVARLVPGRSDVQCRERWMNVLNPDVTSTAPFTAEEDATILKQAHLVRRPNGRVKWAAIAALLPGRTDKAVAMRHARLLKREATVEAGSGICPGSEHTDAPPSSTQSGDEDDASRAAAEPEADWRPGGPTGNAPPACTTRMAPCSAAAAVGRQVWVWWVEEAGSSKGSMYRGRIDAYDAASGQHSVVYEQDGSCVKETLLTEVVAWEDGSVTGPGAVWKAVSL
ncbi:hypothetical protein ACKKBG_A13920 [Auxenochlorella protothecoides x Auxenochlorella symbiontica]